jgi:hypothetical protein
VPLLRFSRHAGNPGARSLSHSVIRWTLHSSIGVPVVERLR